MQTTEERKIAVAQLAASLLTRKIKWDKTEFAWLINASMGEIKYEDCLAFYPINFRLKRKSKLKYLIEGVFHIKHENNEDFNMYFELAQKQFTPKTKTKPTQNDE